MTLQPDDIKAECRARIEEARHKEARQQVGVYFMKFCAKWGLDRMSQNPGDFAEFLNGRY